MGHKLDYDKFFATPQNTEVVKKAPVNSELDGIKGFLKSANETFSIVNKTLGNLGIEPSFLKQKIKEKLGVSSGQAQQIAPYRENLRTPPKTAEMPKQQEKKQETKLNEKMEFSIKKIVNIIDLVLKFTKRENMTVQELKEFLTENETLIEGVLK